MFNNSRLLKEGQTLFKVQSDIENALDYLETIGERFTKHPYELDQALSKVEDFLNAIEQEIEEDKQQRQFELEEKIKARNIFMKTKLTA